MQHRRDSFASIQNRIYEQDRARHYSHPQIESPFEKACREQEANKDKARAQHAPLQNNEEYKRLSAQYKNRLRSVQVLDWALISLNIALIIMACMVTFGTAGLVYAPVTNLGSLVLAYGGIGTLAFVATLFMQVSLPCSGKTLRFISFFYPSSANFMTADITPIPVDYLHFDKTQPKSKIRAMMHFIFMGIVPIAIPLTVVLLATLTVSNPITSGILIAMLTCIAAVVVLSAVCSYLMHEQIQIGYKLNAMLCGHELTPAKTKIMELVTAPFLSQLSQLQISANMAINQPKAPPKNQHKNISLTPSLT